MRILYKVEKPNADKAELDAVEIPDEAIAVLVGEMTAFRLIHKTAKERFEKRYADWEFCDFNKVDQQVKDIIKRNQNPNSAH